MKTKLSGIFSPPTEPKVAMNPSTLFADLESIKANLYEIYNLKRKRIGGTLVHFLWRKVDLEESWPSSQEFFMTTFQELNQIALHLNISLNLPESTGSFRKMIELFIQEINCIIEHVRSEQHPQLFENQELKIINNKIFMVQHTINCLHKYVLMEFSFTPLPMAPAQKKQLYQQNAEEYLLSSALS